MRKLSLPKQELAKVRKELESIGNDHGGRANVVIDEQPVASSLEHNMAPSMLQTTNEELQRTPSVNRYLNEHEASWKELMNAGAMKFKSHDDKEDENPAEKKPRFGCC